MNSNLNNIHILLVEDSLSDQFLMKEILEKTTFPISNLIITESLASATNILSKNKIDLVFLVKSMIK